MADTGNASYPNYDSDELLSDSSTECDVIEPLRVEVERTCVPEQFKVSAPEIESTTPSRKCVKFTDSLAHTFLGSDVKNYNSILSYDTIDENDYNSDDDDMSFDDEISEFGDDQCECVNLNQLRQKDSPFYSKKRLVTYKDKGHFGVMIQFHGSVWKYALPYCITNIGWTYIISYLLRECQIDITIPSMGHKFMVILVSFLVITRVQITYNRYTEARRNLQECFHSCMELMHIFCILTMDSDGVEAKEWRQSLAEKVLWMLRITISALEVSHFTSTVYLFLYFPLYFLLHTLSLILTHIPHE